MGSSGNNKYAHTLCSHTVSGSKSRGELFVLRFRLFQLLKLFLINFYNVQEVTMDGEEKPFYESDHKSDSDEDNKKKSSDRTPPRPQMDSDHKLLLKNSKPLLQSRNSAVSSTDLN